MLSYLSHHSLSKKYNILQKRDHVNETQQIKLIGVCYRVWLAISVHPDMDGWVIAKMTLETYWGKY
jgi:hypothetical protein